MVLTITAPKAHGVASFLASCLSRFAAAVADTMAALSAIEVNDILKGLLLKDLRTNCRARQISPAGGRDALIERIAEHMNKTQNL